MPPDYGTHDPKGWGGDPARGAALGRPTVKAAPQSFAGQLFVSRVRLDSAGYDRNGTYFGVGPPLYWVASAAGDVDFVLRAPSRADARELALLAYPNARIRRSPR